MMRGSMHRFNKYLQRDEAIKPFDQKDLDWNCNHLFSQYKDSTKQQNLQQISEDYKDVEHNDCLTDCELTSDDITSQTSSNTSSVISVTSGDSKDKVVFSKDSFSSLPNKSSEVTIQTTDMSVISVNTTPDFSNGKTSTDKPCDVTLRSRLVINNFTNQLLSPIKPSVVFVKMESNEEEVTDSSITITSFHTISEEEVKEESITSFSNIFEEEFKEESITSFPTISEEEFKEESITSFPIISEEEFKEESITSFPTISDDLQNDLQKSKSDFSTQSTTDLSFYSFSSHKTIASPIYDSDFCKICESPDGTGLHITVRQIMF